jgi:RecB family endonuclease NucS
LNANPTFGGIKFDRVTPNLIVGTKKRQFEFDIVLTNVSSVAIVEIKHKAHINDLDQVEAQIKRYRELCPEYKNFNIYGGIAGFSVPPDVVKAAHERGLFVLKRKGEVLTADAKGMRAF